MCGLYPLLPLNMSRKNRFDPPKQQIIGCKILIHQLQKAHTEAFCGAGQENSSARSENMTNTR